MRDGWIRVLPSLARPLTPRLVCNKSRTAVYRCSMGGFDVLARCEAAVKPSGLRGGEFRRAVSPMVPARIGI